MAPGNSLRNSLSASRLRGKSSQEQRQQLTVSTSSPSSAGGGEGSSMQQQKQAAAAATLPTAPFNIPGHTVYLQDPRRFSLLSVSLQYASHVSEEDAGGGSGGSSQLLDSFATPRRSGQSDYSGQNPPPFPSSSSTSQSIASMLTSDSAMVTAASGSSNASASTVAGKSTKRDRHFSFGKNRASSSNADSSGVEQRSGKGGGALWAELKGAAQAVVHAGGSSSGPTSKSNRESAAVGIDGSTAASSSSLLANGKSPARYAFPVAVSPSPASFYAAFSPNGFGAQSLANQPASSSISNNINAASNRIVGIDAKASRHVSARTTIEMRPHSLTFGREGKLMQHDVPLDLDSLPVKGYVGGLGGSKSAGAEESGAGAGSSGNGSRSKEVQIEVDPELDEELRCPLIEMILDCEPPVVGGSGGEGQQSVNGATSTGTVTAATTSPILPSSASVATTADGAFMSDSIATLTGSVSSASYHPYQSTPPQRRPRDRQPFDPSRLLVKLAPPAPVIVANLWTSQGHVPLGLTAQQQTKAIGGLQTWDEVRIQVRLRMASAVMQDTGMGSVWFVWSPQGGAQGLHHAVAELVAKGGANVPPPQQSTVDGASEEPVVIRRLVHAAGLRTPTESDFSWSWFPSGGPGAARGGHGHAGGKSACAFVEVLPEKALILASWQFWTSAGHQPLLPVQPFSNVDGGGGSRISKRSTGGVTASTGGPLSPRLLHASLGPDAPSIVAALDNDDYFGNGPLRSIGTSRTHSQDRSSSSMAPMSSSPSQQGRGAELKPFPTSSSRSSGSSDQEYEQAGAEQDRTARELRAGVRSAHLDINRTDIALEDAEEDSPVFRAAVAGLEKRTTAMKKACKALLKVWSESKTQYLNAIQADEQLAQAFDELAAATPNTLGQLKPILLDPAREKEIRRAKERVEMMEAHIEKPVQRLLELCRGAQEQIKAFDAESKSYYAGMQKWMSSSSSTSAPSAARSSNPAIAPIAAAGALALSLTSGDVSAEKQQLRNLSFARARIELYAVMSRLHGGKAELELFKEMTAFAAWCAESPNRTWGSNWPTDPARTTLTSLYAGSQQANVTADSINTQVLARLNELEAQIGSLEVVAGEPNEAPILVRAPGQRIRNLLTTFGIHSSSTSSAPSFNHDVPASSALGKMRGKMSKRLSLGSTNKSEMAAAAAANGLASPASAYSRGLLSPTSPPISPMINSTPLLMSTPLRPTQRLSHSSEVGDESTELFAVEQMANSPSLARRSNSLHSHRPSSNELDQRKRSVLRGRSTTEDGGASQGLGIITSSESSGGGGQDRKKQGVLWVSKPISGSGGVDAPRGVSRAYHWHEAWVVLSGSGHLGEYAEWKDAKILEPSAPMIDLRFATVREARGLDRRFTFEIVTRDQRRFFQAPDEAALKEWMGAIAKAIESLINGTSSVRQVDKVARSSGRFNGFADTLSEEDEFGRGTTNSGGGYALSGRFSQSLTDLTNPGIGAARLLQWGSDAAAGLRPKRDSRVLSMVSESEQGISNKTPLAGYLGSHGKHMSREMSESGFSIASDTETDFDKRIEEMVHTNYGGSTAAAGLQRRASPLHGASASTGGGGLNSPRLASASSGRNKEARAAEINAIARRAENSMCADCRAKEPRWAAWALGGDACCIFICIACSGVHRSLGVQVSKVKSVDLDDWTEEQLEAARNWGNLKANAYWEHARPETAVCRREDQSFWIQKYRERAWTPRDVSLGEFELENKVGSSRRDSLPTLRQRTSPIPSSSGIGTSGLRRSSTENDTSAKNHHAHRAAPSPRRLSSDFGPSSQLQYHHHQQSPKGPNFSLPTQNWRAASPASAGSASTGNVGGAAGSASKFVHARSVSVPHHQRA